MIDWGIASTLLASMHRKREAIGADAERLRREFPRFQNIDYPISPFPVAVAASHIEEYTRTAERYVSILEHVNSLYQEYADVRAYFGLPPAEENIVRADLRLNPSIRICRLDGYIAQNSGKVRYLENNTDCPAGILFTERLNRLVDKILEQVIKEAGVELIELPLDKMDRARQELLTAYKQFGGEKTNPTISILQIKGRSNIESIEMAEEFSARGTATFVSDPRELEITDDGIRLEGKEVDLVWNKINTVYWNQLVADSAGLLDRWTEVVSSGKVCHVNPFVARYVSENKLCAAFLQEDEFARYFEASDSEFLKQVLPWSRKVVAGKKVEYDDKEWDVVELLLARQSDFVVKQPYDIRGDGVTIGRSVERDSWVEVINRAAQEGHTAQEFINGQHYPVLVGISNTEVTPMTASLDSFVFGGRLVGLGSKAGLGTKVNVFQGGQKLAVRVYAQAGR